ncbi:PI-PLC X domain-containing protein [Panicum miliaceum]|uniref:PI-PLC X domain-containing protein n=1 Tax=Panicum miliaceum TaxID=4540 RepID=A0A3L6QQG8_PANMI|nr:PI-PLC X domain-containing protein [Panicum miliaceum]
MLVDFFSQNGVRALMLDVYDFRGDVRLCHSKGGKWFDFTTFMSKPNWILPSPMKRSGTPVKLKSVQDTVIDTMREIEAIPSEIVTLILEDYMRSERGLPKLFLDAGLARYRFPVSRMPRRGGDWLRVHDMVARGHRLLVFTSPRWK